MARKNIKCYGSKMVTNFVPDSSIVDFVNSPAMSEIKERSCFIHVDVPGHEESSPDLPDS